jgi:hypothetical protein
MHIAGNHAFVGGWERRFDIIDISDPTRPVKVREWRDTRAIERVFGLAVEGDRFYVASWYDVPYGTFPKATLSILDINNPRHPQVLGRYESEEFIRALAISGDHAYIVGENSFLVVDASDPRNPHWIGSASPTDYWASWWSRCVVISGDYAYVACELDSDERYRHALLVFDIRDPSNPILVGKNLSATRLGEMIIDDGKLYAAGTIGISGLFVYDLYRPPLRLDPPEFLGLDGWRLRLWGGAGQSLRLQRSPDLSTWEDWQTTIGSDLPQEFIDDTAGTRPRQFYRAVAP